MVAREYTRGARSAGHPGAPDNEETHPRPEPTPEPNAVRAVPEPATERLAVAGERSGPPSPSLPYQEMALVHQNQNQNPPPRAKPAGRKAPPKPVPNQSTIMDFFKLQSTTNAGSAHDEPPVKPPRQELPGTVLLDCRKCLR